MLKEEADEIIAIYLYRKNLVIQSTFKPLGGQVYYYLRRPELDEKCVFVKSRTEILCEALNRANLKEN